MANEFRKVTDQNGVDHPVCDDTRVDWPSYAKTGVHNINLTTYTSKTENGITWTPASDGGLNADGTTPAGSESNNGMQEALSFTASFTGMVKLLGGYNNSFYLFPYDWTDSARPYKDSSKSQRLSMSDNQYGGSTPLYFYIEKGHKYSIIARVNVGTTVSNAKIYPLLEEANDNNTDFALPAMTNRELTEKVTVNALDVSLTTAAAEKAEITNNDCVQYGNIVNIRMQLHVTAEISAGTQLINKSGISHKGYGTALIGNGNGSELYNVFVSDSSSALVMTAKSAIPAGYYAFSYMYVMK